ncbi:MAG: alpha/beta hydrolase [Verrucomicrobia bacterium]|nr:alpha/beta hydrolase [Verrucomicrobiota bacterium]
MSMLIVNPVRGRVVFEGPFASEIFATNRFIRIYLPPSYDHEPRRRYPVLYLHDGQNVFSTVGTNIAFGWGNWALDTTVDALVAEKRMQEIIMVAIDCSAQRYRDYLGPTNSAASRASARVKRSASSKSVESRYQKYARFLIDELKPHIDRTYRTRPGPAHTGAMGSSMGGICSLALAWEHPETFGLAASLSGAFQVEKRSFLANQLRPFRGRPKKFRAYLDSGVVDYSGGDDGRTDTDAVASELRRIGWRDGKNLLRFLDAAPLNESQLAQTDLRRDKWKEAQTSQHNEFYWRLRAWRALTFLFPPK